MLIKKEVKEIYYVTATGLKNIKSVYLGTSSGFKKIRPNWKPSSDTLLYMPFTDDVNNKSSSGITITNNGVSIVDYNGVKCASFNGTSNYLQTSNFSIGDNTTIIWYNRINDTSSTTRYLFKKSGNLDFYYGYSSSVSNSSGTSGFGMAVSSGSYTSVNTNGNHSTRTMFVGVKSGTNYTIYSYDGIANPSFTKSGYNSTSNSGSMVIGAFSTSSSFFKGYLGQYIVESRAWTKEEIDDYYNLTKSEYKNDFYTENLRSSGSGSASISGNSTYSFLTYTNTTSNNYKIRFSFNNVTYSGGNPLLSFIVGGKTTYGATFRNSVASDIVVNAGETCTFYIWNNSSSATSITWNSRSIDIIGIV